MDMSVGTILRRVGGAALGAALALLLAGCLLSPGRFTAALDLRKDGGFTYSYKGEIYMLALSRLAEMANEADADAEFIEAPCYDDEYNERDCTEEEIEEQREAWAQAQEAATSESKGESEAYKALFGGIDPADPEAAQEIAQRLTRQKGWNSVEYKGDGLFVVDFSITSRMTHDFVFPVFESFPMANSFVQANLRDGNTVRIDAPGFSVQAGSGNPIATGFMQAAAIAEADKNKKEDTPPIPELQGTFTITTDGTILANNTDEGPIPVANGQQLSWTVSKRTSAAPTALIKLGN